VEGIEKESVLASADLTRGITPLPNITVFSVSVNPDPRSVIAVPERPLEGAMEAMMGFAEGGVLFEPPCAAFSAARVRGPTMPYPVVSGVPDETIPCFACHRSTARAVSGPKNPVTNPSG
jgi:hypothetical protein